VIHLRHSCRYLIYACKCATVRHYINKICFNFFFEQPTYFPSHEDFVKEKVLDVIWQWINERTLLGTDTTAALNGCDLINTMLDTIYFNSLIYKAIEQSVAEKTCMLILKIDFVGLSTLKMCFSKLISCTTCFANIVYTWLTGSREGCLLVQEWSMVILAHLRTMSARWAFVRRPSSVRPFVKHFFKGNRKASYLWKLNVLLLVS